MDFDAQKENENQGVWCVLANHKDKLISESFGALTLIILYSPVKNDLSPKDVPFSLAMHPCSRQ